ncbi:MAG: L-threonylcarbamoyladenylate synthase [Lentimicrobiaceae bacterium]|jgi:tRNA threonylcarbamoyl adenosine modification protein (Sua5/YciO/YrdC/YwlC family)|nr:L-threonylcarbamoyladenylate synthase [Lentimicrobiaceae bacterium]
MLLKIHGLNPSERQLLLVADCLRSGGVIIYPTDTVYGLGCDITQSKAIERIAQLKGIKKEKAQFSFICNTLSQLSEFTLPIDNHIFRLMRKTLPGPFTFIVKANSKVPNLLQSKKKTVGIRIPDHAVPLALVQLLGNPILTTSVHDDDEIIEYTTDPELIYEKYKKKVDIVIDSGFGGNLASTVLDCTGDEIQILRQGKGEININDL